MKAGLAFPLMASLFLESPEAGAGMRASGTRESISTFVGARESSHGVVWLPPPVAPATLDDFQALADNFQQSSSAHRRLMNAAQQRGRPDLTWTSGLNLADMGAHVAPARLAGFSGWTDEQMSSLSERYTANRRELQSSQLFDIIPSDQQLVEGLAWEPRTSRLFASAIVSRQLLVRDEAGWQAVPEVDGGSLSGLAADERHGLLWISSGVFDQTPSPETAFRGLIALDVRGDRVVRRIPAPGALNPADLAVGDDGAVFASDPLTGAILAADVDDPELRVIVPPRIFRSPQGLAIIGSRLYVSDYHYGLAVVDLHTGRIHRVASSEPAMLDGIDGLMADGQDLVAIQNGTDPMRIIRLRLSEDGLRVDGLCVLERQNREWGEPTLGTIRGDHLLYVADAQWDVYGAGGAVSDSAVPRPTSVRILSLDPGARQARTGC